MKIDMKNVFIGTIRVCTKYNMRPNCIGVDSIGYIDINSSVAKENAKLLKATKGGYVDFYILNNFLDEIKVKNRLHKEGGFCSGGLIIGTRPNGISVLFVD